MINRHHRRQPSRTARVVAPIFGGHRFAEMLEDRTLLSGFAVNFDIKDQNYIAVEVGNLDDAPKQPVDQGISDLRDTDRIGEESLVAAETADDRPSVEPRDPAGDVRLTASFFKDGDSEDFDVDLSESESEQPLEQPTEELPSTSVSSTPSFEFTADGELSVQTQGILDDESTNRMVAGSGLGIVAEDRSLGQTSFPLRTSLERTLDSGKSLTDDGATNSAPLDLPNSVVAFNGFFDADSESTSQQTTILNSVQLPSTVDTAASEIQGSLSTEIDTAATVGISAPAVNGLRQDVGSSVGFSAADIVPVSQIRWIGDETAAAASVTLPSAIASETAASQLLTTLDPAEVSHAVTKPFQPVIGFASSVVVMLQTIGRTALLAVFGEGGSGGGPIAEFVEPMLELADVGEAPDRWELKTVDAALPGPVIQTVTGDRHFEIRNIGPATDDAGSSAELVVLTLLTLPRHGVLEHVGVQQNVFRYVPDPGFSGVDEFRYRLKTSTGDVSDGQLVINVPSHSHHAELRTASREIQLQVVDRMADSNANAFADFEDWRSGLD